WQGVHASTLGWRLRLGSLLAARPPGGQAGRAREAVSAVTEQWAHGLDRFVFHAERVGTELVYEAAARLSPLERGSLARPPRRPRARPRPGAPPPPHRHELPAALAAAGEKPAGIVELPGCSSSPLPGPRAAGPAPAETPPQSMQPSGLPSTESARSAPESSSLDSVEKRGPVRPKAEP